MISPRNATMLARTKLHSRRGMLFASISVSSILFAVLIAGVIVFSGAEKSATSFIQKANDNKYLVQVNPVIPSDVFSYTLPLSIDDIHRITELQNTYYAQLRATYKQLAIPYDSSTEIAALRPSAFLPATLPQEQRVEINYQSPVIALDRQQKLKNYAATAKNTFNDLKNSANKYHAEAYYTGEQFGLQGIPNMMLVHDGKENFEDMAVKAGDLTSYGYFTNAIHNGNYQIEDEQLLQRYLLSSADKPLKGIPVVVSAQEAAALFGSSYGIGKEPQDAAAKVTWLQEVQTKLNGYTYQVCYRNATELAKIQKIQQDYADMAINQNNPTYKKPSLLYSLPQSPCGAVGIQQDTRSPAEKKSDDDAVAVQKALGAYRAPVHRLLTFQIVGLENVQPFSKYTDDIQSYLRNLLSVEDMSMTATIPKQLYNSLPAAMKIDDLTVVDANSADTAMVTAGLTPHIVAFRTIDDARNFMSRETCPGSDTNCSKLFTADPYGSNYLILNEIGGFFQKSMWYAVPVVAILAFIIVWFTVARVMAENRKEIAIYRAMGAKRTDIVGIYMTYSLIVALRISLVSIILGGIAAFLIDRIYGSTLTNIAVSSFGNVTGAMRFSLFDISSPILWLVPVMIFIVTIVASIQPLIRNVLRPPINDMRSE